jgi:hypothetical protein
MNGFLTKPIHYLINPSNATRSINVSGMNNKKFWKELIASYTYNRIMHIQFLL